MCIRDRVFSDPQRFGPSRAQKHPACVFALRAVVAALALGVGVAAQDSWPTYHGDFTGQRHSRLTQIGPENVRQLTLAWSFQTGQTQQIKASPILVDGVIYITTPDNMWALDARSAKQLWRYTYPTNQGFHICLLY